MLIKNNLTIVIDSAKQQEPQIKFLNQMKV